MVLRPWRQGYDFILRWHLGFIKLLVKVKHQLLPQHLSVLVPYHLCPLLELPVQLRVSLRLQLEL